MKQNYYQLLGVNTNSTPEAIKNAYREKAKIYHPDKDTGDEEMFKAISDAYEVLKDPASKKKYDLENGFATGSSYSENDWKDYTEFYKNIYNDLRQKQRNSNKKYTNDNNPLYKEITATATLKELYDGFVKRYTMGSNGQSKDVSVSFPKRKNKFVETVTMANGAPLRLKITVNIPIIKEYDKTIRVEGNDVHVDLITNSFSKIVNLNLDFIKQYISFSKPQSNKRGPFMVLPEMGLINEAGEIGNVYINFV